jgi:hypothetical protein
MHAHIHTLLRYDCVHLAVALLAVVVVLDLCSCTSVASQGARSQHHSEIAVGARLFQTICKFSCTASVAGAAERST